MGRCPAAPALLHNPPMHGSRSAIDGMRCMPLPPASGAYMLARSRTLAKDGRLSKVLRSVGWLGI